MLAATINDLVWGAIAVVGIGWLATLAAMMVGAMSGGARHLLRKAPDEQLRRDTEDLQRELSRWNHPSTRNR